MGNIGGGEILVILLLALLVLGPSKLPEAARQAGRALAEFRKVTSGFQRELRSAIDSAAEPQPVPASQLPEPYATPNPGAAPATETPSSAPADGESATANDSVA